MEELIFGILRYVKKKKQVKVTQHLANHFTADRSSEENEGLALRSSAFGSLYCGKFISFWLMTVILL